MTARPRPRRRARLALLAAVVGGCTLGVAVPAQAADLFRVEGANRVATAVAAAQSFAHGGAAAVVLARSDSYADSLAAAPLASDRGGPLLLNRPDVLEPQVRDAILDVLAPGGTVYLLGGDNALSPAVADAVRSLPGVGGVERIAGSNRYATAVAVASKLPASRNVALVTGLNFPDGLAAGALMGVVDSETQHSLGVVLLTQGPTMPAETRDLLRSRSWNIALAVGGPAAQAAQGTISARTVSGSGRFETGAAVAGLFASDKFFKDGTTRVGIATGENWPDALSGSALMAYGGGPLILTARDTLPSASRQALVDLQKDSRSAGSSIVEAHMFGGTTAISPTVEAQVGDALR
ncbi:cell wall-binding repeat-containing protein [Kineococcus gynurae]|uniref:Cell wall-binding repeat-containing protein n=1 Tax=Kineococcus gynurae TaxID=452979 RepID=A0ABV5LRM5_9ACTN